VRRAPHRFGHRRGIAVFVDAGEIARNVVVQLRRARRERRGGVDHGGELLVVEADLLGRILGRRGRRGDYQRDLLADVAHAPASEHVAVRHLERELHHRRRRFEMRHVLACEEGDNTVAFCRFFRIELPYDRVRAIRSQEAGVELPVEIPIRGVAALPGKETIVLAPALEAAHAGCGQDCQATNCQPCGVRVQALRKVSFNVRGSPFASTCKLALPLMSATSP
jgi:hypothetical protein